MTCTKPGTFAFSLSTPISFKEEDLCVRRCFLKPSLCLLVNKNPGIKIYFSEYCPYCKSVEALMNKKNISFEKIDVDLDTNLREEMVKISGRTSVPQVFVNDLHLGGCDDVYDLENKGELDSLIFKN